KKHTKFFLLLTMVFGGITGVGLWFTIALLNPAATSKLIHIFVFGWATEWVFFVIEIVALFIYYYTFDRMNSRDHVIIGWIYFGAAWMSLFIINGIIDFMLTPGEWLQNGDFWSGFFNPTFWPALFFRTFLALLIAGLFGIFTATFSKDERMRVTMLRYSGMWLIIPLLLLIVSAWWYKNALPPELKTLIFQEMADLRLYFTGFALVSVLLVLGGLILAVRMPTVLSRPVAFVMLFLGLCYIGAFEFIREGGRKPYIIYDYMYSTSILKRDMERVKKEGILKQTNWVGVDEINDRTRIAAGREIFNLLCLPCHSLGGPINDIVSMTKGYTPLGMEAYLSGMEIHHPEMPPFAGTAKERSALAHFISLQAQTKADKPSTQQPVMVTEPAAFDIENDEYVLLGWSSGGGLGLSDGDQTISLGLSPKILQAQLIGRGETPEIISESVSVHYRMQPGGMEGVFEPAGESGLFQTSLSIEAVRRGGVVDIEAHGESGEVIAKTTLQVPSANRMGCFNCHGGDQTSFNQQTAKDILEAHDSISRTDLRGLVKSKGQVQCQQCHSDTGKGNDGRLTLSAAIHGFHLAYFRDRQDACTVCHMGEGEKPKDCLRGIHRQVGLDCSSCHGTMEEHSVSLLKAAGENNKRAGKLLAIVGKSSDLVDRIQARRPWVNQPDCLSCHLDFDEPQT
ncbi:MAG: cytochrome C, partial [Thermodesulfobacteriota bacterium]